MAYTPDYMESYVAAIQRHHALFDQILDRCIDGNIDGLLEWAGDQMNACDAVDDVSIARWGAAKAAVSGRGWVGSST